MGYQPGKGLGKDLQGRSVPVEAQVRKGRGAVGNAFLCIGLVIDIIYKPIFYHQVCMGLNIKHNQIRPFLLMMKNITTS